MHKLSHVEAQRVLGVLGETLERLAHLAKVPERTDLELLQRLAAHKSGLVLSNLETQFQLEEALAVERDRSANAHTKESYIQLEKKLRVNTRGLCRALREDGAAQASLCEFADARLQEEQIWNYNESKADYVDEGKGGEPESKMGSIQFTREVTQLHSYIETLQDVVFRSLTTTVEEEHSQKLLYQTVSTRTKEAQEDLDTLTNQLAVAQRNRELMSSELDTQIGRLEVELREIKNVAATEAANLEAQTTSQSTQIKEEHEARVKSLQVLEKKLSEESAAFAMETENTEMLLTKKNNKYKGELNTAIKRYDRDMVSKQIEIDQLRATYEEEKEKLDALEEHFQKVDLENARIAAEEEEWKKFLEEKYEEERIYDDGAAAVQKLWRGYQGRVAVKSMNSKKGGKKKK